MHTRVHTFDASSSAHACCCTRSSDSTACTAEWRAVTDACQPHAETMNDIRGARDSAARARASGAFRPVRRARLSSSAELVRALRAAQARSESQEVSSEATRDRRGGGSFIPTAAPPHLMASRSSAHVRSRWLRAACSRRYAASRASPAALASASSSAQLASSACSDRLLSSTCRLQAPGSGAAASKASPGPADARGQSRIRPAGNV
jgi:hypothetical protein